jgi:repressor LexA
VPIKQVVLSPKRRELLEFMSNHIRDKGYPPSFREIGEAVGLKSPSSVYTHLNVLEKAGYLVRDPTKPRAIEVRYEPESGAPISSGPVRHVPLIGDVAAGTGVLAQENVEGLMPLPEEITGTGQLFMVKVRGDSMIEAGILDGDYVVVRSQPDAQDGEIVVAGIPGPDGEASEGTVKTLKRKNGRVVLEPANPSYDPIDLDASQVKIFGKVVTLLRKL